MKLKMTFIFIQKSSYDMTQFFFFLSFQAYNAIHLDLERYLRSHGINQVTIQPEFPGELTDDQLMMMNFKDCCLLNCHSDWCEPQKCCDETKVNTTVII